MGTLLEAIEAEEVVVRGQVEELEAQVAELMVRLDMLERNGLVERSVHPIVPPRVE